MSIFVAGDANVSTIVNRAQQFMINLRDTFKSIADLQAWIAAQSDSDLEALGFSASDLGMLRSALADANALGLTYTTGLPPGTYPQPASAYVYAASQRLVIGPK
jgi:hypothetical protein